MCKLNAPSTFLEHLLFFTGVEIRCVPTGQMCRKQDYEEQCGAVIIKQLTPADSAATRSSLFTPSIT